jgi:hypothetical protein
MGMVFVWGVIFVVGSVFRGSYSASSSSGEPVGGLGGGVFLFGAWALRLGIATDT